MRATLRRSCNACARAKLRCDLRTPKCSRCAKKRSNCIYANEPLTSSSGGLGPSLSGTQGNSLFADRRSDEVTSTDASDESFQTTSSGSSIALMATADASFDPFDSYPPTRLPRTRVQRLIHHCDISSSLLRGDLPGELTIYIVLSSIAFQYYPLDLDKESNPFVISWWPLALSDPALFHVSLQTASLDEELRAQQGFPISELLMVDSVFLVRRKIEDTLLAFQDETLNAVVTLAAIEHGKGNIDASRMHIEGIKRMVKVRGGIHEIKRSSPLTARMVSWVSMLVTATPQFETEDELGHGLGVGSILQWQLASTALDAQESPPSLLHVEPIVRNVLARLRHIFHQPQRPQLTTTDLHDLTCFVVHKLLLLPPFLGPNLERLALSECLRYALAIYMLIIHGTTYYSHAHLANAILGQLRRHLITVTRTSYIHGPIGVWILSVATVSTIGIADYDWFKEQLSTVAITFGLHRWEDVVSQLQSVLWVTTRQGEIFQQIWEEILTSGGR